MRSGLARRLLPIAVLSACLAGLSSVAKAEDLHVTGTIDERVVEANIRSPLGIQVTSMDTVQGDLAGFGLVHIFSSELSGSGQLNAISVRRIRTTRGELFLSEVGSRVGDVVLVASTVIGGTGVFRDATGQLALDGTRTPSGVFFNYAGTVILH